MNKAEFITHIADQYQCTKVNAEKAIDMFISSVIDAMGQGKEISLLGFGNFTIHSCSIGMTVKTLSLLLYDIANKKYKRFLSNFAFIVITCSLMYHYFTLEKLSKLVLYINSITTVLG